MKKTISTLFLCAGLIPLFAWLSYDAGRMCIRKKMEQAIESLVSSRKVVVLTLTSPADYQRLQWEEDQSEFSLDGCMYDVVSMDTCGTVVHIRCLADQEESELIGKAEQLTSRYFDGDSPGHHKAHYRTKAQIILFFESVDHSLTAAPLFFGVPEYLLCPGQPVTSSIPDTAVPPPEAA